MKKTKGFIVALNSKDIISEIRRDDFDALELNKPLLHYLDKLSLVKYLSFLSEVKKESSAIGWEVNLLTGNTFNSLFLSGFLEGDKKVVLGSLDDESSRKMLNELMKVSNDQNNQLRTVLKESTLTKSDLKQTQESFDELTRLNSEILNVQRALAKKNKELEKVNNELNLKNEELDQFAYIVTHDLKAPLRGISSVIDMIEEDFEEEMEEDLLEMFQLIKKRAFRMNDLITSILEYTRADKINSEFSSFKLDEMLKDITDALAFPDSFQFIKPDLTPELYCSYTQLSQVLMNLIGNGFKYHDKSSGKIELKIEEAGDEMLRFAVIDDGPGIPEKYHEKVFGVFETANNESRTDSTGVGLAIVKKLVLANGGEIGLNSEMGKGSEFWFTWPLIAKDEE